jgi:hypothetical protein
MEDQIKELIAKGIKLDYSEHFINGKTILRWGNDKDYITCEVTPRKSWKNALEVVDHDTIMKIKNSVEVIIEESIKDFGNNHQKQVDDNSRSFQAILPAILEDRRNQYALMKDCKIIEYFSTAFDAEKSGLLLYPDHMFSVQKVTDEVINLGAFSL